MSTALPVMAANAVVALELAEAIVFTRWLSRGVHTGSCIAVLVYISTAAAAAAVRKTGTMLTVHLAKAQTPLLWHLLCSIGLMSGVSIILCAGIRSRHVLLLLPLASVWLSMPAGHTGKNAGATWVFSGSLLLPVNTWRMVA